MRKILFIDHEKCTGCEICVLHCSFTKTETFNPARARVNVIRWEEEGICVPSMCMHCADPPCTLVCPLNALNKDEETGATNLDTDLCIGCKRCMMLCPFGALSVDPFSGEVFKCDLCAGEPVCAQVCPTGAIQYLKADRAAMNKKRQGMEKFAKVMEFALTKTGGEEK